MDGEQETFSLQELDDGGLDGDAGVEVETPGDRLSTAEQWKKTLKKIINCVVVLKVTQTRPFDTEGAGSSYATGFIVDKRLGLILTNRHVVTPGPVVAEAVFQNREEVRVRPLYYDPIHDFGFFRFDPSVLQFMTIDEIPLAPEAAAVGMDIRVVGNDSGEKISILSGTLARLDRDAPHYGRKHFNDFNVHYLQAASGTKGGSSGSPVIDVHGRAIALNAGGKNKAASAYYLPLQPVVRALNMLRSCALPEGDWCAPMVPRGDLQATFLFKGFDEVKRLGLRPDTEADARSAQQADADDAHGLLEGRTTGMLIVDSIVPGGPCDEKLEPGDVLIRLDGAFVSDFLVMESLLDSKVGSHVRVEVERGGEPIAVDLAVENLHAVTPASFVEVGGGTVHEMSYQQARNNRSPVGQVYVAEPGYLLGKAGLHKHAIITALDGKLTPNLAEFTSALLGLTHGQRVPLEYFTFDERNRKKNVILHVDWCWYGPPVRWERDDGKGVWEPTTLWPDSLAAEALGTAGGAVTGGAQERGGISPTSVHSPKISSPRIQASCAASSPRDSARGGGLIASTSPPPIPRRHSIMDVAVSHDLEKEQAGVTAQGDDTRMRAHGNGNGNGNGGLGLGEGREGEEAAVEEHPEGVSGAAAWRVHLEQRLRCALVAVDVEIPLVALADGVHSRSFSGCGVVVHISDHVGVVLVDRNTVPIGPGDIMLSFGAFPAEVPARVRFLHPLHNFSLLSFDPQELSSDARRLVTAVTIAPTPPLQRGDSVELVCLSKSMRVLHRTSTVTNPAMPVSITQAEVPRFRAVHEEVIKLDQDFGLQYSGVLADRSGRVRALWGSYSEQVDKEEREWTAGLPSSVFLPWVDHLIKGLEAERVAPPTGAPKVRVLDAELEPLLLSKAAQFGLPAEWVNKLVKLDPERRQVLRVRSTVAGSHAQKVLQDSDMVLAVEGQPVSSFADVEKLIAAAAAAAGGEEFNGEASELISGEEAAGSGKKRGTAANNGGSAAIKKRRRGGANIDIDVEKSDAVAAGASGGDSGAALTASLPQKQEFPSVRLTLFRAGGISEVSVLLGEEDGLGTNRLIHWCGAQLQSPHRGVRELGFVPDTCSGVYISRWHHGSPAHRYGLYALHWILEVNGVPTPDIDAFLKQVRGLEDGADVRLKVVHFETNRIKVLTLKTDQRYWPTWELRLDAAAGQWTRCADGGSGGDGV